MWVVVCRLVERPNMTDWSTDKGLAKMALCKHCEGRISLPNTHNVKFCKFLHSNDDIPSEQQIVTDSDVRVSGIPTTFCYYQTSCSDAECKYFHIDPTNPHHLVLISTLADMMQLYVREKIKIFGEKFSYLEGLVKQKISTWKNEIYWKTKIDLYAIPTVSLFDLNLIDLSIPPQLIERISQSQ